MSGEASNEDLDPAAFVRRIRELSERHEREDAERVSAIEADIEKGRSERAARRAESARSLSPDKTLSPKLAKTTPLRDGATTTPAQVLSPSPSRSGLASPEADRMIGAQSSRRSESPSKSASSLARSGTLSWQQRPSPSSPRRPQSVASRAPADASEETIEPTRDQIAEKLGAKDPAWFRQTSDRGLGNAAYRRNHEDSAVEAAEDTKFGLPGMARVDSLPSAPGGSISPPPDSVRSSSPSRGSAAWSSSRFSAVTSKSTYSSTDEKNLAGALDPPKLGPSDPDPKASARPGSPTKGAGGFVQSAMMKRSDSVSKRWSTQAGQPLHRQNSSVNVPSGLSASSSMPRLDHSSGPTSGDGLQERGSRPGSSLSVRTMTQELDGKQADDAFVRPSLPLHTRSKSTMSLGSQRDSTVDPSPPPSPSKRWSPTKSSWLESAINRPESTGHKPQLSSQPSWMADLKAKQHKTSESVSASPVADTRQQSQTPPPSQEMSKPRAPVDSTPTSATKATNGSLESKAKPKTPPKKDLQTGHRPHQASSRASGSDEPEFKNALGKLRRTETKNYVAPETFTNNIKAGKAALNVTGGVPARVRRDEVKENLLRQKEAIRAKKEANTDKPPSGIVMAPKEKPDIPEFLAARKRMNERPVVGAKPKLESETTAVAKPSGSGHERNTSGLRETGPARANEGLNISPRPTEIVSSSAQSSAGLKSISSTTSSLNTAPLKAGVSSKLADRFNPNLAKVLARGPPASSGGRAGESISDKNFPGALTSDAMPGPPRSDAAPLEHKTKGRAKGPKRRAPVTKSADAAPSDYSRARDAPSSTPAASMFPNVSLVKESLVLGSDDPEGALNIRIGRETDPKQRVRDSGQTVSPQLEPTAGASSRDQRPAVLESSGAVDGIDRRPYGSLPKSGTASFAEQIARKAGGQPTLHPKSSPRSVELPNEVNSLRSAELSESPRQSVRDVDTSRSIDSTQFRPRTRTPSPEMSEPSSGPSVRNAAARWSQIAEQTPPGSKIHPPPGSKIHPPPTVKSSTQDIEQDADSNRRQEPAAYTSGGSTGLGLGVEANQLSSSLRSSKVEATRANTRSPMSSSTSVGIGKTDVLTGTRLPGQVRDQKGAGASPTGRFAARSRPPSITLKPPPGSPSPQTSDTSKMIASFFDQKPVVPQSIDVDTQALLTDYPINMSKTKTIRKQVHEMRSDGRLSSLAPQEEYTLFEGSIYAVSHTLERDSGVKSTEAYLWVGAEVSPSAAEDAQIFAKRFAKDNKAVLIILAQGKETPSFLQALGGVAITRRGLRSQRSSQQEFMLCGRQHLGHIVFDEVDFSLRSFSSGFPFLVFAGGKLHLWKGAGCTVEEVSCARLVAMDIGLAQDVVEVVEGREPAAFIDLFPMPDKGPKKIFPSADHWQRKSQCDRYRTRLFHVSALTATSTSQQQSHQGGFQVSSLWPPTFMGRRPSWSAPSPASTPLSTSTDRSSLNPQASIAPATSITSEASGLDTAFSIVEIAPYTQSDMEGKEGVFVLDAFFEVYTILTPRSRSSASAFTAALLFAQDYGMLAASLEDRPFVPVSSVVLEGAPRDMKACFRKWNDARWTPGSGNVVGSSPASAGDGITRGRSLKVVGLDAAITAAMGG